MSSRSEDGQVLSRETYPEPKTKAGVVSLVREVLDTAGPVDRIIMERGHPVRVWRWVDREDLMEDEVSLDGALRNAEIIEYTNNGEDATPQEMIFDMVQVLHTMERCHSVCWATGVKAEDTLRRWLYIPQDGKPYDIDTMAGIPVQRLKSLPEDTLLLCGAPFADGEGKDVSVAIKTALEMRRSSNAQVVSRHDDRGRNHPQKRGAADGEVAHRRAGNGREGWQPSSFIRARLGGGAKVR